MQIEEIEQRPEEFADVRRRPAMTRADAQRIAAAYKKRQAAHAAEREQRLRAEAAEGSAARAWRISSWPRQPVITGSTGSVHRER
jgi:hypothetical protein